MMNQPKNYHKNQLESSEISSGKDTHIGDNISIHYNFNMLVLLGTVILIVLVSLFMGNLYNGNSSDVQGVTGKINDSLGIAGSRQEEVESDTLEIVENEKKPIPKKIENEKKYRPKLEAQPEQTTVKLVNLTSYYNASLQGDITIVNLHNDVQNLTNELNEYFQSNKLRTVDGFFKPNFIKEYHAQLTNGELSIFGQLGVKKQLRCTCIIDAKIKHGEGELDGYMFKVADGKFTVRLLNLNTEETSVFTISEKGAGGTRARAIANLEQKIIQILEQKSINFSLCKS